VTTRKTSTKKKTKKYLTQGQIISNLLSNKKIGDTSCFDDYEEQSVVNAFRELETDRGISEDEMTYRELFSILTDGRTA
jgi:hypothetical protein